MYPLDTCICDTASFARCHIVSYLLVSYINKRNKLEGPHKQTICNLIDCLYCVVVYFSQTLVVHYS